MLARLTESLRKLEDSGYMFDIAIGIIGALVVALLVTIVYKY